MIGWSIGYIIVAMITALGVSAYNGNDWGARRCVVIGAFWFISLPLIALTIGYDRIMNGRSE